MHTPLKHLDLFSGIGGFALAAKLVGGIKTEAFCEIDPFCTKVLQKHWRNTPVFKDIKNLTYGVLQEAGISEIDIITGGFPCQPWSQASRFSKGEQDERHLWPEMARLISEVRPTWVCGENVYGIIPKYLDTLVYDLEDQGYQVWPTVVPACSVGAPHRRYRLWLVAHTDRSNSKVGAIQERDGSTQWSDDSGCGMDVGNPDDAGSQGHRQSGEYTRECYVGEAGPTLGDSYGLKEPEQNYENDSVPDGVGLGPPRGVSIGTSRTHYGSYNKSRMGGAIDGVPRWLDGHKWPSGKGDAQFSFEKSRIAPTHMINQRISRLTALGNAIVPQVAAIFLSAIVESHRYE